MKQDLLVVSGGIVAFGLVMWSLSGNPSRPAPSKVQVVQKLDVDRDLKAVSERSPYMRSER